MSAEQLRPQEMKNPLYIQIDDELDRLNYSIVCLEQLMEWIINGGNKEPELLQNQDKVSPNPIPAMLLRCMPERLWALTKRVDDLAINLRGVFE